MIKPCFCDFEVIQSAQIYEALTVIVCRVWGKRADNVLNTISIRTYCCIHIPIMMIMSWEDILCCYAVLSRNNFPLIIVRDVGKIIADKVLGAFHQPGMQEILPGRGHNHAHSSKFVIADMRLSRNTPSNRPAISIGDHTLCNWGQLRMRVKIWQQSVGLG